MPVNGLHSLCYIVYANASFFLPGLWSHVIQLTALLLKRVESGHLRLVKRFLDYVLIVVVEVITLLDVNAVDTVVVAALTIKG